VIVLLLHLYAGYKLPQHLEIAAQGSGSSSDAPLYHALTIPGLKKNPLYLYKRKDNADRIVRTEMIYITAGEPYFFRLIAKSRAFTSFADARTVNGTVYPTFQQAAIALDLVEDDRDARTCFEEAAHFNATGPQDVHLTPARLRGLFAHLTLNGYPTLSIFNDEALRDTMLTDILDNGRLSKPQVSHPTHFSTFPHVLNSLLSTIADSTDLSTHPLHLNQY
jgi:hypothetical protein